MEEISSKFLRPGRKTALWTEGQEFSVFILALSLALWINQLDFQAPVPSSIKQMSISTSPHLL